MYKNKVPFVVLLTFTLCASVFREALAQKATPKPPTQSTGPLKIETSANDEAGTLPERIEIQSLKKKYWTVGNEDMMDVVQNRIYKKKGRVEISGRYGFYSDDPFMNQKTYTGMLGYHFNEFFSAHVGYTAANTKNSAARNQAIEQNFTPVVNPLENMINAELRGSLIYGKLSLTGKKIIYYDLHLIGGFGRLKTQNGDSPIAPYVGIGQQIYLTQNFFVLADYRLMKHTEKYTATTTRSLTTNWIQVGVGVYLP